MKRSIAVALGAGAAIIVISWLVVHLLDASGTVPAWIEAFATLAAFMAAVLAVYFASNAFRLESDREQARIDADARAQASLIAAWWGIGTVVSRTLHGNKVTESREYRVWLRNASPLPVTNVDIQVALDGEQFGHQRVRTLPPEPDPLPVPMDDEATEIHLLRLGMGVLQGEDPSKVDVDVTLIFTDASGQVWRRDLMGITRVTFC